MKYQIDERKYSTNFVQTIFISYNSNVQGCNIIPGTYYVLIGVDQNTFSSLVIILYTEHNKRLISAT